MAKIHRLSAVEARKIAAGEVVERPASVVKELLENSFDAGATAITITLENGGKDLIVVTDNGCGMDPEDARLSLEHHATSKITRVDELTSIQTFGFRGEALSSIAAVSEMALTTRTEQETQGWRIVSHHGTIVSEGPCSAAVGTEFRVANLFAELPARRKFLKQRDTEWRAVYQLVQAYALSSPHVSMTLIHDGAITFTVPACSTIQESILLPRAQALFDQNIAHHLIPLATVTEQDVQIVGVISDHQVNRYDRKAIFCFVNGRWVKNGSLGKALIAGYAGVLQNGKFPAAMLSITLPPHEVDINIHPRKEEVLLLHPVRVSHTIEKAVSRTLNAAIVRHRTPEPHSTPALPQHNSSAQKQPPAWQIPAWQLPAWQLPAWQIPAWQIPAQQATVRHMPTAQVPIYPAAEQLSSMPITADTASSSSHEGEHVTQQQTHIALERAHEFTILGTYHRTYILVEREEGLLMVDQHAAHERVMYNKFSQIASTETRVQLMFSEIIPLSNELFLYAEQLCHALDLVGITAEPLASHALAVRATPPRLHTTELATFVRTTAQDLYDHRVQHAEHAIPEMLSDTLHPILHRMRATIACKTAVKAGDSLTAAEQYQLLEDYFSTENRLTCPHGRPTCWLLSIYELEKRFKRV